MYGFYYTKNLSKKIINNMTFKQNWEKADEQHQLPLDLIEKMIELAYPNKKLISHQIISGGCANLNIKIQLKEDKQPLILRIYLRDKTCSYREQKLSMLLKQTVPVPLTFYIGEYQGYCFAITEFMPGITLRNLLLGNESYNIDAIMYEVGEILAKIAAHEFPKAGFFDQDLNIISEHSQDGYLNFAKECLKNTIVIAQLSSEIIARINFYLDKYKFPGESEKNLVHADFDPANILVDKIDGNWKVTAILDWEFSFSGSVLCDVANMLRYKHHMPAEFEKSFLKGLKTGGIILPENWFITVHMLNLLSLLDCLVRSDPKNRPNQLADICGLISHIIRELDYSC